MNKLILKIGSGLLLGVTIYFAKIFKISNVERNAEKSAEEIYKEIKKNFSDKTEDEIKEMIREAVKITNIIDKYIEKEGDLTKTIIEILKQQQQQG